MNPEDKYLCIWKAMSLDKNSTTFQDVTEKHALYRCKEYCDGYGHYKECGKSKECGFYYPLHMLYSKSSK